MLTIPFNEQAGDLAQYFLKFPRVVVCWRGHHMNVQAILPHQIDRLPGASQIVPAFFRRV
jgi:hypothetical protein